MIYFQKVWRKVLEKIILLKHLNIHLFSFSFYRLPTILDIYKFIKHMLTFYSLIDDSQIKLCANKQKWFPFQDFSVKCTIKSENIWKMSPNKTKKITHNEGSVYFWYSVKSVFDRANFSRLCKILNCECPSMEWNLEKEIIFVCLRKVWSVSHQKTNKMQNLSFIISE